MSITRRQFLVGMARSAAGILIPTFVQRASRYLEDTGFPLLVPQPNYDSDLVALYKGQGEYELNLGDPYEMPPSMTFREYADEFHGFTDIEAFFIDQYGWEEEDWPDPDDEAPRDWVVDHWARHDSPNALAFHYLSGLDLEPEDGYRGAAGKLEFIDGDCPGNDYLGVAAIGEMSLSLLQERLNQLDARLRVVVEQD